MIIKSLSLKSKPHIGNLIRYIQKQEAQYINKKTRKPFEYTYNMNPGETERYIQEFQNMVEPINHLHHRVKLRHFVISFSGKDRDKINADVLRKTTRKFIGLYNKKAKYLTTAHADKAHIHLHVLCSGLEIAKNKSTRIQKDAFSELQQNMQLWQRKYFPELSASLINYGHKERSKSKTNPKQTEFEIKKRQRTSKKSQLIDQLHELDKACETKEELLERIKDAEGLDVYSRNGKLTGIISNGRKYRFKTVLMDHLLEPVQRRTKNKQVEKQKVQRTTPEQEKPVIQTTNTQKEIEQEQPENQENQVPTEQEAPQYQEALSEIQNVREAARNREQQHEQACGGRAGRGAEQEVER